MSRGMSGKSNLVCVRGLGKGAEGERERFYKILHDDDLAVQEF